MPATYSQLLGIAIKQHIWDILFCTDEICSKGVLVYRQHNFTDINANQSLIKQHVSTNRGHLQALQYHKKWKYYNCNSLCQIGHVLQFIKHVFFVILLLLPLLETVNKMILAIMFKFSY